LLNSSIFSLPNKKTPLRNKFLGRKTAVPPKFTAKLQSLFVDNGARHRQILLLFLSALMSHFTKVRVKIRTGHLFSETTNPFATLLNLSFTYGGTRALAPRGNCCKSDCPDNKIMYSDHIIIVDERCKSGGDSPPHSFHLNRSANFGGAYGV
jgi:hypothetical protein